MFIGRILLLSKFCVYADLKERNNLQSLFEAIHLFIHANLCMEKMYSGGKGKSQDTLLLLSCFA